MEATPKSHELITYILPYEKDLSKLLEESKALMDQVKANPHS